MNQKKKEKTRRMAIILPVELEEEIRQVAIQTGVSITFLKDLVAKEMVNGLDHVINVYLNHVQAYHVGMADQLPPKGSA